MLKIFLAAASVDATSQRTCPQGWHLQNKVCYFASTSRLNQHTAIAACAAFQNGNLLSIEDQAENNFAASLA